MSIISFPTSKDIYIEINGRKLAIAQGYKAKTTRESKYIEAFGQTEPAGTVGGRMKHVIELSRVCVSNILSNDGISFHELSGFNVVIAKPDRKIIYSGCEWADISEGISLGDVMVETITAVAKKRIELR